MKIEIIRQTANKKQLKKNIFLGFLCLLMVSGFLFFILSPVMTKAQEMNNGLENFRSAANYANTDLPTAMGRIMKIVLGVLGLAATVIVIMGGFKWMTSGGDENKISEAKKLMMAGIVGILIIVLAYAISSFIIGKLMSVTPPPPPCVGSSCLNNPYNPLPVDVFKVKRIESTHGSSLKAGSLQTDYHQDVYLCSAVQPMFNNWINAEAIKDLAQNDLRVETTTGGNKINGEWQTRDGIIIFKHQDLFNENTEYTTYLPKAILNTSSKTLQDCLASGTANGKCIENGSYFIWNFTTGTTTDKVAPTITSVYPILDQTNKHYPDQNVSLKPAIEVNFSEAIDATTVIEEDSVNPISDNIWLAEIDKQGGIIKETLLPEEFTVNMSDNGFRLNLSDANLLKPFTWYRIHVSDIKDLCSNKMAAAMEWEFQTNDRAPGISSVYPEGNKVCLDSNISIVFNTQMYDNNIDIEISDGVDTFTTNMTPSVIGVPYQKVITGGIFKVDNPKDPIDNGFRIFTFEPTNNLKSNTKYTIKINTDLVIDQKGALLAREWNFTTATPETCLCSPWISSLNPEQGSNGQCLTISGACFTGTDLQSADPKIEFILNSVSKPATIGGKDKNYITTVVPSDYIKSDQPQVQVTIKYRTGGEELVSNPSEFTVDSDETATGPCLWSINPSSGYPSETSVNLSGLRFGPASGQTTQQVKFYNNQSASFKTWSDNLIEKTLVPTDAVTGNVAIINDAGTSNGIPFTVLPHVGSAGSLCRASECPSNPLNTCTAPYQCKNESTDTCRCCCDPKNDLCASPLHCLADQGSCNSTSAINPRGLCCGCTGDDQCGAGAGCGMLDSNRCCYNQPTVKISACSNPQNPSKKIGNNTAISIIFSDLMNYGSLKEENIKIFEETAGICKLDKICEQETSCNCQVKNATVCTVNKNNKECNYEHIPVQGRIINSDVQREEICKLATLNCDKDKGCDCKNGNKIVCTVKKDKDSCAYYVSDHTETVFYPSECRLEEETLYKVTIRGGINGKGIISKSGVSIKDKEFTFTTGNKYNFCDVDQIKVSPVSTIIKSFKEIKKFTAQAKDTENNSICVPGFIWGFPDDINVANYIESCSPANCDCINSQGPSCARNLKKVLMNPAIEANVQAQAEGATGVSAFTAGKNGLANLEVDLISPVITSISPEEGTNNPIIPTYVTITGINFGSSQGESKIMFGNVTADIACQNWSDKSIVAIVPPSLDKGLNQVTIFQSDQGASNQVGFKVQDSFHPAICKLQPNFGKTGDIVSINGKNFGDTMANNGKIIIGDPLNGGVELVKTVNNKSNPNILSWSNQEIKIKMPEVAQNEAEVTVSVPSPIEAGNPLKISNPVTFHKAPIITSITPGDGPKKTWITIHGYNFGSVKGVVSFKYNNTNYSAADLPTYCGSSWSDTQIIVEAPQILPDVATDQDSYNLQIEVDTDYGIASQSVKWTLNKKLLGPALCSINPSNGWPGFSPVTIQGERFNLASGESARSLVFNKDKEAAILTWSTDGAINNIAVPQDATSGNVVVTKTIQTNSRQKCIGISFGGKCFGKKQTVWDEIKMTSNPLHFNIVPLGGCGIFGTLDTRDRDPILVGEKENEYPPVNPFDSQSVGTLATDGKYLYTKSWSGYDQWPNGVYGCTNGSGCEDNMISKIGTGYQGTVSGKIYKKDLATVNHSLTMTYFPDDWLYNGYTNNGHNLERVNVITGAVDYVEIPSSTPLMNRETGRDLTELYEDLLITSDGKYVYNLAHGINGSYYNGFRVKIFDPNKNWQLVKEWTSIGSGSYIPSFYTDGIIADGDYIYAIQWGTAGGGGYLIRKMEALTGKVIAEWTSEQKQLNNPQGKNTDIISGQYDWVNNKVWLGDLVDRRNADNKCDQCSGYCHCTPAYIYRYACQGAGQLGLPQVIGDANCETNLPSPSPAADLSAVCSNAVISARFNQKVSGLTPLNILVQKCNNGSDNFNSQNCTADVAGSISLDSFNSQGFIFTPTNNLDANYWYQITLKSGSTGIKNLNNYSLDGNKNNIQDGEDNYFWHFKTGSNLCSPEKVKISETVLVGEKAGIIIKPGTRNYFAQAFGPNCQILKSASFSWTWTSTKSEFATVGSSVNNQTTATGVDLGETDITVTTTQPDPSDATKEIKLSNKTHLIVATRPTAINYPAVGSTNICLNTSISATFDQLMDGSTLNSKTIKFYKVVPDLDEEEEGSPLSFNQNINKNILVRFFNNLKNVFLKKTEAAEKINISVVDDAKQTKVYLNIDLLDEKSTYKIEILGGENGVKSKYGIGMTADKSWTFITGKEICKLSEVKTSITGNSEKCTVGADKKSAECSKENSTVNFKAIAKNNRGEEIQSVTGYQLAWSWKSSDTNVATISNTVNNAVATVKNKNGSAQITATAEITGGKEKISNSASIKVFLCEVPWIFEDKLGQAETKEPYTNFRLQYCQGDLKKNLVSNGSFEIDKTKDGIPDNWLNHGKEYSTDGKNSYSGKAAIKPGYSWCQPSDSSVMQYDITIKPNTFYTFSAYVKGENIYAPRIDIRFYHDISEDPHQFSNNCAWYNGGVDKADINCSFSGVLDKDSYKRIYFTFNSGSNDKIQYISLQGVGGVCNPAQACNCGNSSGKPCDASACPRVVWFDNLQLEEGKQPSEYQDFPSLPYLVATETTKSSVVKEFIFTNSVNNDVIGLKVLKNPDYLTPFEWYKKNVPNPGSPTSLIVNGYQAVKEGRTVYVGATNVDNNEIIEGLIYLISYSDNAKPETIDIFNKLVEDWQFNTNKTVDKQLIQRDLFRLYDLRTMSQKLADYKSNYDYYPKLESGSFMKGITDSKWPSWKNPQGQFISSMPNDPINQFLNPTSGYCAGCNNASQCDGTCYNQSTSKYECPVGSHVYQYMVKDGGADYSLYLNFETDSLKWQKSCSGMDQSNCEIHYLCGWAANKCQSKLFGYSSDIYKCFDSVYGPVIGKTIIDSYGSISGMNTNYQQ
ncbi:MAG: Ig-like domain-containing protein [Patescibacteria group bacterium]|nr:Ig-like domain-containing protein [Patescibacteria group bacterium]